MRHSRRRSLRHTLLATVSAVALTGMPQSTQCETFPPELTPDDLNGTNGLVIDGIGALDEAGWSVGGAGDINGDGIDDLIIGAPDVTPNGRLEAGATYVVFGTDSGFGLGIDLAALDGSDGFVLNGIDEDDYSGYSVSAAGDVNGDGIGDIIIGAPEADRNGKESAGESYVVFGSTADFPAVFELSDLLSENGGHGSEGFVLRGVDAYDYSGRSVSGAGDINGDGIDDVIIGAPYASFDGKKYAGESYVVFGRDAGQGHTFPARIDLEDLNGGDGFALRGIGEYDEAGWSVSGAGDINGDGIGDVIVGAPYAGAADRPNAGESYVVFGRDSIAGASFPGRIQLGTLDGSDGVVLKGAVEGDGAGEAVSAAGDVNGDGIDDVIVGAPYADLDGKPFAGRSYVVFGLDSSQGSIFTAGVELADLDGSDGFVLNGVEDRDLSGWSVSGAGDVNGDGIGDVIVGAPYADPDGIQSAGESYVVFGLDSSQGAFFAAEIELADLDGSDGFVLTGTEASATVGLSVSGAGDVNGNGLDDVVIGAAGASPGGRKGAGEIYLVLDSQSFTATVPAETGVVSGVGSGGWTAVTLDRDYGSSMVVVATPVYGAGDPPVVMRVRNASGNGFELRAGRMDGSGAAVTVDAHYLVVEEGVYTAAEHGVTMEAAKYTSTVTDFATTSWVGQARAYGNSYAAPVVVGQVMTANDADPSVFWARGSARTSPPSAATLYTGKTVLEDADTGRAAETVGYIVIEAGTGVLAGQAFSAGVGSDSVQGMDNAPPYGYGLNGLGSSSVAVASVAGMDGSAGAWAVLYEPFDTGGSRLDLAVDEDRFRDAERLHTTEQVAYIVFGEPAGGGGPGDGVLITADLTPDAVDERWYSVDFAGGGSGAPVVLASMQTADGSDVAGLRLRSVGTDGFEVFVEEEQSADSETGHTFEVVGYAAFEPGEIADGGGAAIGETGTVTMDQGGRDRWHTLTLAGTYIDPVVMMTMTTHNGAQPAHARIRNVTAGSFEWQIEEWGYLDGSHITETMAYAVLETGIHTLADGRLMEVGTVDADHAWTGVDFAARFGSPPVVLSHGQTVVGGAPIVTRQRNATAGGVQLRVQEEQGFDGIHPLEQVGYVALER